MINTGVDRADEGDGADSEAVSSFGGSIRSTFSFSEGDLPPTNTTLDLDLYVRLSGRREGLHPSVAQSRGELATRDQGSQGNSSVEGIYSMVGRMVVAQQQAAEQQVASKNPGPGVLHKSSSAAVDERRCTGTAAGHADSGEVRERS